MDKESSEEALDVAISFLSQDEDIAKKLFNSLKERLEVFYYADRQPELVGTDGEESFGKTFRDKARVVVVFYRKGWGETPMTRAEKSGIKQRAIKEGYNFSIWVPLDDDKSVPAFLDPQFIWYDYDRWGIDGLCAVVEEKVKESGKKVRPENTFDKLNKIKQNIELDKERNSFERSPEGVEFVDNAESKIQQIIENRLEKYNEITNEIRFSLKTSRSEYEVNSHPFRAKFYIFRKSSNWINQAKLAIDLQKNVHGNHPVRNFKNIESYEFKPTLNDAEEPAWWLNGNGFYSLESAIHMVLDELAEQSFKEAERNRNQ